MVTDRGDGLPTAQEDPPMRYPYYDRAKTYEPNERLWSVRVFTRDGWQTAGFWFDSAEKAAAYACEQEKGGYLTVTTPPKHDA